MPLVSAQRARCKPEPRVEPVSLALILL